MIALVPEVTLAGEHHGQVGAVGGLDHLLVAQRAAGLDDGAGAGFGGRQKTVGKGEEGIGSDHRALGSGTVAAGGAHRVPALLRGDTRGVDTAHLAGADADRGAALGVDDGVRLDVLGNPEGEDQSQREKLEEERAAESREIDEIQEALREMNERLRGARARLELLQARLRQGEARRAIGKVMNGVSRANLHEEFDRISDRVELDVAAEKSYAKLDASLSGDSLRRKAEESELDERVDERMEKLRVRSKPPKGTEPS